MKDDDGEVLSLSFEPFFPTPEPMKKDGWYNWRISHWGCKWDASESSKAKEEDSLVYYFSTAWAPPIAWVVEVSKQYPELSFLIAYEEGGCEVYGDLTAEKGEVVSSTEYNQEEYLEKHSEGYLDEKEFCMDTPIEELAEHLKGDQLTYAPNEKRVLSRIEDKDLHLFSDVEWNDYDVEEQYKDRAELHKINTTSQNDIPLLIGGLKSKKAQKHLEELIRGQALTAPRKISME